MVSEGQEGVPCKRGRGLKRQGATRSAAMYESKGQKGSHSSCTLNSSMQQTLQCALGHQMAVTSGCLTSRGADCCSARYSCSVRRVASWAAASSHLMRDRHVEDTSWEQQSSRNSKLSTEDSGPQSTRIPWTDASCAPPCHSRPPPSGASPSFLCVAHTIHDCTPAWVVHTLPACQASRPLVLLPATPACQSGVTLWRLCSGCTHLQLVLELIHPLLQVLLTSHRRLQLTHHLGMLELQQEQQQEQQQSSGRRNELPVCGTTSTKPHCKHHTEAVTSHTSSAASRASPAPLPCGARPQCTSCVPRRCCRSPAQRWPPPAPGWLPGQIAPPRAPWTAAGVWVGWVAHDG